MIRAVAGVLLGLLLSTANALTAQSYIVTEMDGTVLLEKDADSVRSIASITKLFTTRTAAALDLNELIEIVQSDMKLGHMRSTPLRVGQKYSRGQLMELALVSSDNVAAMALGRVDPEVSPLPPNTTIVEASGLDAQNQSTARSLAIFARELVTSDLARTSVQPTVSIAGGVRKSTNPLLLRPGWTFHLSKTGFINASGGCLVVVFEAGGRLLTAVILGSRDVPTRWRDLYELRHLLALNDHFAPPDLRKPVTKSKHRYK